MFTVCLIETGVHPPVENKWKQLALTYVSSIRHFLITQKQNYRYYNLQRYKWAIIGLVCVCLALFLTIFLTLFGSRHVDIDNIDIDIADKFLNQDIIIDTELDENENEYEYENEYIRFDERGTLTDFVKLSSIHNNHNNNDNNENEWYNENEMEDENNQENEFSNNWIRIADIDWYSKENYESCLNSFIFIQSESNSIRPAIIYKIDQKNSVIELKYLDCDWSLLGFFANCQPKIEMYIFFCFFVSSCFVLFCFVLILQHLRKDNHISFFLFFFYFFFSFFVSVVGVSGIRQ